MVNDKVYEIQEYGDGSGSVVVTEKVTGLKAYRFYRKDLTSAHKQELSQPGVYFRFHRVGTEKRVYIGQSNNVFNRMNKHLNDQKASKIPFITEMLFFVKSDYTNSDTLYLEHRLTELARDYRNITVDTNNTSEQILSDAQCSILNRQIESIIKISVLLGYPMYDENLWDNQSTEYLKLGRAKGFVPPHGCGLVVLAGSRISDIVKDYAVKKNPSYIDRRKELIAAGVIVDNVFTRSVIFPTAAEAGTVVTGSTCAGIKAWNPI